MANFSQHLIPDVNLEICRNATGSTTTMTSRRIVTSILLRSTTSTKPLTPLVFRPKVFPSFQHSTTLRRSAALRPLLQQRWHSVSSGDEFKVYGFPEV